MGQLGDNNAPNNSLNLKQIGTDNTWQTVYAGYDFTLAIKNDGTLWAWGNNAYGQLGRNISTTTSATPISINSDKDWQSISCGVGFSLAIKKMEHFGLGEIIL